MELNPGLTLRRGLGRLQVPKILGESVQRRLATIVGLG
jgi:hypothetical protein